MDKTVVVFTLQEDGRYGRPQMYAEDVKGGFGFAG